MKFSGLSWAPALALLLGVAVGCSGSADEMAGPVTLVVGPDAEIRSIQQAVDDATSGATIYVHAGTYTEWVDITKSLTIVGSGPSTVVVYPESGPSDAAVLAVHDVTGLRIEGLSVRSSVPGVDGIRVRDARTVTLLGIVASGNTGDGLDMRRSSGVDVSSGTFEANGGDGVQVDDGCNTVVLASVRAAGNRADGLKISLSAGVVVRDSVATLNEDDGILVRDSNHVRLERNSATSNVGWGISINASPDTVLEGNTAVGNGSGEVKCEPDPCS